MLGGFVAIRFPKIKNKQIKQLVKIGHQMITFWLDLLNVVKCSDSTLKKGYDMQQRLAWPWGFFFFLIKTDYELLRSVMVCISIGTVLCINPTGSDNTHDRVLLAYHLTLHAWPHPSLQHVAN